MADYVLDIFVADAVLAGAVRDLQIDKVALSSGRVKVALSSSPAIKTPAGLERPEASGMTSRRGPEDVMGAGRQRSGSETVMTGDPHGMVT